MQQQHAALDAVAGRGTLERVDQVVQRLVETEDGIAAVVVRIVEEAVVDVLLATALGHIHAVRQDHVVEPLIRGARDFGVLAHDVEILLERSHPVLAAELFAVLTLGNQGDDLPSVAHLTSPVSDFDLAGRVIVVCASLQRLHVSICEPRMRVARCVAIQCCVGRAASFPNPSGGRSTSPNFSSDGSQGNSCASSLVMCICHAIGRFDAASAQHPTVAIDTIRHLAVRHIVRPPIVRHRAALLRSDLSPELVAEMPRRSLAAMRTTGQTWD